MKPSTTRSLALLAGLSALGACHSSPPLTAQDRMGHYASTSDYRSMDRVQLTAAMDAGLLDVDRRKAELETMAQSLGSDVIEELHDREPKLIELRTDFVNELARLRAALDANWKDRRDDVVDAFTDLRKCLDKTYEEVLEQA